MIGVKAVPQTHQANQQQRRQKAMTKMSQRKQRIDIHALTSIG
jgi:hypothetical protein